MIKLSELQAVVDGCCGSQDASEENANGIVALCNAAPVLLEIARLAIKAGKANLENHLRKTAHTRECLRAAMHGLADACCNILEENLP